jgi:hypothetical protein
MVSRCLFLFILKSNINFKCSFQSLFINRYFGKEIVRGKKTLFGENFYKKKKKLLITIDLKKFKLKTLLKQLIHNKMFYINLLRILMKNKIIFE